tara:strand:+ start:8552 stop:9430 length:879 start_codon:yes stop_codon:yes gene_type:complete
MQPLFNRVAVIGVGLLGGSLALACKKRGIASTVVGYGRQLERIREAQTIGIVDQATDNLKEAIEGADLVVLCTPVEDIPLKARELSIFLKPKSILTDVGSVKESIVTEIEKIIPAGRYFVGSHPIAGGEQSGFEKSNSDLYQNALSIITPTKNTHTLALDQVTKLWERLGSEIIILEPEEHDLIYGSISHMPHAIAFALMNTLGAMQSKNHGDLLSFGGKGLLDYTRIASSDPIMWRDIFLANRKHILNCLKSFQGIFDDLKENIEHGDGDKLQEIFKKSNGYREKLLRRKT